MKQLEKYALSFVVIVVLMCSGLFVLNLVCRCLTKIYMSIQAIRSQMELRKDLKPSSGARVTQLEDPMLWCVSRRYLQPCTNTYIVHSYGPRWGLLLPQSPYLASWKYLGNNYTIISKYDLDIIFSWSREWFTLVLNYLTIDIKTTYCVPTTNFSVIFSTQIVKFSLYFKYSTQLNINLSSIAISLLNYIFADRTIKTRNYSEILFQNVFARRWI